MTILKRAAPLLTIFLLVQFAATFIAYADTNRARNMSYTSMNVIAAYTLKMIHFVDFPDKEEYSNLCVIGDDLFGVTLAQMQSSSETHSHLIIKKKSPTSSLEKCRIIFFGEQSEEFLKPITYAVKEKPILTMSNLKGALEKGVMINFVEIDNAIKIDISLANARNSGVKISSKLIGVARRVIYE